MDFNSHRVLQREKDAEIKLEDLNQFETSDCFSDQEKVALAYTERVVRPDLEVDEDLFERLRAHFSEPGIVELTALIGLQALSASFNASLDIPAQGLCKYPINSDTRNG